MQHGHIAPIPPPVFGPLEDGVLIDSVHHVPRIRPDDDHLHPGPFVLGVIAVGSTVRWPVAPAHDERFNSLQRGYRPEKYSRVAGMTWAGDLVGDVSCSCRSEIAKHAAGGLCSPRGPVVRACTADVDNEGSGLTAVGSAL